MLPVMLSLLGGFVGLVILAALVAWLVGRGIPVEHQASSEIDIEAPPQKAFDLIADVQSYPQWVKGVVRVEMLPEKNGLQTCRMHMGRNSFVLVRTKFEPPHTLERTIEDDHHAQFSGTWLYAVRDRRGGGCTVKLTEIGRIRHAIPRAMIKHLFGYHMYLNMNLQSIGKKLGAAGGPRKA